MCVCYTEWPLCMYLQLAKRKKCFTISKPSMKELSLVDNSK